LGISNSVQRLAFDERRIKFLPEYAYGGRTKLPQKLEKRRASPGDHESPGNEKNPSTADAEVYGRITKSKPSGDGPPIGNEALDAHLSFRINSIEKRPHTVEVLFAGTHSDM